MHIESSTEGTVIHVEVPRIAFITAESG
jgi:hypothetical protein